MRPQSSGAVPSLAATVGSLVAVLSALVAVLATGGEHAGILVALVAAQLVLLGMLGRQRIRKSRKGAGGLGR
jgi:hypothetical protein